MSRMTAPATHRLMVECSRSLSELLTTPMCSMSEGRVVDARAVGMPLHPDLQVGQWHAVGEVSVAGPLPRSPTTLECMMTAWVCLQGVSTHCHPLY